MKIEERIKDMVFRKHEIVTCIYCGKDINVGSELEDVEYVVTKAGNTLFFHSRCYNSNK